MEVSDSEQTEISPKMGQNEETQALTNTTTSTHRDLDDVVGSMEFGRFHVKMLILTCGAYFSACAEMLLIVFLSKPVKDEWELDDMVFPVLPFCSGIISFISSFTFGSLSDRFGRQKPLLVALVFVSIFGLCSAFAPYFWLFVILRACTACGTSGIETVNFVLLLEFLPRKKRGCIMVIITLCGALGAVVAAAFAWALLPRYGWRWFVGACSLPAWCVLGYRLWFSYESPRYLYISGQHEKGEDVLVEIARQNKAKLYQGEIKCPPSVERGRIQDLFSKDLHKRTIFSSLVWCLQSMGYWGVTMYLPEYMGSLGIDPYFNMFTVFIGEIPGLVLAMILIEPHMFGRIKCLRFFSGFTATGLLLFAFIPVDFLKAVFVIIVYFFMVPIYSILNTYTPEVYPTTSRSTAMAWMYMVIAFPGLITAFLGASVLSTNISWLYPTISAGFFTLQFLFTFGLGSEPAGQGLVDTKTQGERAFENDVQGHHDDCDPSNELVESHLTSIPVANDDETDPTDNDISVHVRESNNQSNCEKESVDVNAPPNTDSDADLRFDMQNCSTCTTSHQETKEL